MAEVMYEAESSIRATELCTMSQSKKEKDKDKPRIDEKSVAAKDKGKAVWATSTPQNQSGKYFYVLNLSRPIQG